MKPYYVLLTGSKNNAGDFLIKDRAKALFFRERPDRDIVDVNAWESIEGKTLEKVNNAQALILMGGPSLRFDMYPGIYRMTKNLGDIRVPITFMGVGWKSVSGNWRDTYRYPFSSDSMELLKKADKSGLPISVRDYHSLNSLKFNGIENVMMTGCPAYYDLDNLGITPVISTEVDSIGFSLGVSFVQSARMERQMKRQIRACRNHFENADLKVLFHHSLEAQTTESVYGDSMSKHLARHHRFARWLEHQQIPYKDISGSAQNLIECYSSTDLHIGYRVHAHIFMNSIGRPSLLLSEDGRAKGCQSAIGGMVIDGYEALRDSPSAKISRKLTGKPDRYVPNRYSTKEMIATVDYELRSRGHRTLAAQAVIRQNFLQMKRYLTLLP